MATAAIIPPPRWKIPPFATGSDILASVAHLYRPQENIGLSAWAIRHRGYDPETLPWQLELMDALSDPETSEVGIMKPSQCGATTIGAAWAGWIIDTDPSNMLICQPDKGMAEKFVKGRLDPMIEGTGAVKGKLLPLQNANNQWIKLFRGMMLTTVWPVASQFTQVDIRFGWLDDFDQYDDNIGETAGEGGQGSAIKLLDGRFISFEGREKKYVSSSPAKGEGRGIEAFVAEGTDERLWPECPHCEERFEIDFLRDFHFDAAGTADDAERTAHVVCPVNGCYLEPSDRRKLHDSCYRLPNHGFMPSNALVSKRRRSFRLDGLMALPTWPTLARSLRSAQIAWETRQDESDLRTVINTQGGKNYRSVLSGEKPLDSEDLAQRREPDWKSGTIPAWAKVVLILVDVQQDRFELAAIAYGNGLESGIVRRWSIDAMEDGLTGLSPLTHPEHFRMLLPLFDRKWPLAFEAEDGATHAPTLAVGVDTGGSNEKGDKATAGVKYLWNLAKAAGIHQNRLTLIKGGSNPKAELMPRAQFSDQKLKGGANPRGPKLWRPNVHAIKNIIDARLRRATPGPGYIHLPGDFELRHVDELTAEQLEKGKWKALRPRNETWDLVVYGYAVLLRPPFAQSRTHMRWVPKEYRVPTAIAHAPPLMANPPVKREMTDKSQDQSEKVPVARELVRPNKKASALGTKPKANPNWLNRRGR